LQHIFLPTNHNNPPPKKKKIKKKNPLFPKDGTLKQHHKAIPKISNRAEAYIMLTAEPCWWRWRCLKKEEKKILGWLQRGNNKLFAIMKVEAVEGLVPWDVIMCFHCSSLTTGATYPTLQS